MLHAPTFGIHVNPTTPPQTDRPHNHFDLICSWACLPACLPSSSAHKLAHALITGKEVNLSGPMSFSYIPWKSSIVKINPKPIRRQLSFSKKCKKCWQLLMLPCKPSRFHEKLFKLHSPGCQLQPTLLQFHPARVSSNGGFRGSANPESVVRLLMLEIWVPCISLSPAYNPTILRRIWKELPPKLLSLACWGQRTHNVVSILFLLLFGQLPSLDNCFITQTLNCFIPSLGLGMLFTCILHPRTGHVGLLFTSISQPSACLSFVIYTCVYQDSSGACKNLLVCWIFYRWRHLCLKPFS